MFDIITTELKRMQNYVKFFKKKRISTLNECSWTHIFQVIHSFASSIFCLCLLFQAEQSFFFERRGNGKFESLQSTLIRADAFVIFSFMHCFTFLLESSYRLTQQMVKKRKNKAPQKKRALVCVLNQGSCEDRDAYLFPLICTARTNNMQLGKPMAFFLSP